jgi:hypothetical protein
MREAFSRPGDSPSDLSRSRWAGPSACERRAAGSAPTRASKGRSSPDWTRCGGASSGFAEGGPRREESEFTRHPCATGLGGDAASVLEAPASGWAGGLQGPERNGTDGDSDAWALPGTVEPEFSGRTGPKSRIPGADRSERPAATSAAPSPGRGNSPPGTEYDPAIRTRRGAGLCSFREPAAS